MGSDFYTVLDQALALLRSRGRATYNALKLQFNLDDAHLAVLKEELLYTHPEVVDDAGRGLIWTSDESFLASRHIVHSAIMRLYEDLVSALLQREGRVSYRTLTQLFGLDEASLNHACRRLLDATLDQFQLASADRLICPVCRACHFTTPQCPGRPMLKPADEREKDFVGQAHAHETWDAAVAPTLPILAKRTQFHVE